jgi:hypothetical protein
MDKEVVAQDSVTGREGDRETEMDEMFERWRGMEPGRRGEREREEELKAKDRYLEAALTAIPVSGEGIRAWLDARNIPVPTLGYQLFGSIREEIARAIAAVDVELEHGGGRGDIETWSEATGGRAPLNRWRCRRCGTEGTWVHDGQAVEGIPGGHLYPEAMRRQMKTIDALFAEMSGALKLKMEKLVENVELPLGTIVAAGASVILPSGARLGGDEAQAFSSACAVPAEPARPTGRLGILNTSVLTADGDFTLKTITLEQARGLVTKAMGIDSAVGHESTARILTTLLGVEVEMNRQTFTQMPGQSCLVFKLNGRPEPGRELSEEEVQQIGFSFKVLTRVDSGPENQ